MGALNEDVFRIENGDIPASYVSLPEGMTLDHENSHHEGVPTMALGPKNQL